MRFGRHRDLVRPNWHIQFGRSMVLGVDSTPELRHRDNIRLDTAAKSTLEWYDQIGCARLQLICK
jgi:hypothetical protein